MAFYVVRAVDKCPKQGCKKLATHRVYGPRNDRYGDYCERHASAHAAELEKVYEVRDRH